MHKAPILEGKQIEHVLNERRILEEASGHPFCVGLVRAYQDKPCLYLLQEWVGGMCCCASAVVAVVFRWHSLLTCAPYIMQTHCQILVKLLVANAYQDKPCVYLLQEWVGGVFLLRFSCCILVSQPVDLPSSHHVKQLPDPCYEQICD